MGRGSSGMKNGPGDLRALVAKAEKETSSTRVLNSVDDSKLGVTFQKLPAGTKAKIKGFLSLTKDNVLFLSSGQKNNAYIDAPFRANGKLYRAIISISDGKIVYSLKQGNKNIIKNGTYENVVNHIARMM